MLFKHFPQISTLAIFHHKEEESLSLKGIMQPNNERVRYKAKYILFCLDVTIEISSKNFLLFYGFQSVKFLGF